jgi:hypothetical protein
VLAIQRSLRTQTEVKPLSPYHRIVIALHSPATFAETGLLMCRSEKTAARLAETVNHDIFLWSGFNG